jgi:tetratricopeptide (TPR) repeat protein
MAATPDIKKNKDEITLNQKLYDFLQKNRRMLLIFFVALIVILAGLIITVNVRDKIREDALTTVDGFNRRYAELMNYINSTNPADIAKQVEISILLFELAEFQNRASGFAAARAYWISADILMTQENWAEAEQAWASAARAAGRSYLAPLAFFNAAVAAEEQGKYEEAIEYYNRAVGFENIFPSAPRAQFAIGRIEEMRYNREGALAAYRNLLARWPNDPVWSNLSQSRIIFLTD